MSADPHPAAGPAPSPGAALAVARERAIRVLTDRYADDTIPVEEFEARLDRLYAAESPGAVGALVDDLRATAPVPAQRVAPAPLAPAPLAPSGRGAVAPAPFAPAERRVLAVFGESRVTGPTVLPYRLEVQGYFADVQLDLRDATFAAGELEIALSVAFANCRILLPADAVVELQAGTFMASVRDDTERAGGAWGRQEWGGRRVRITGMAALAELIVRAAPAGEPFRTAWKAARPSRRG